MSNGRFTVSVPSVFSKFTFFSILIPGFFTTAVLFPIVPWELYRQGQGIVIVVLIFAVSFLSGMVFYVFSDGIEMLLRHLRFINYMTPIQKLHDRLSGIDSGQKVADAGGEAAEELSRSNHTFAQRFVEGTGTDDDQEDADADGEGSEERSRINHIFAHRFVTHDSWGEEDETIFNWSPEDGYCIDKSVFEDKDGVPDWFHEDPSLTDTEFVYRYALSEAWGKRAALPNTLVNMNHLCRSMATQAFVFLVVYWYLFRTDPLPYETVHEHFIGDITFFYMFTYFILLLSFGVFFLGYVKFGDYFIDYLIVSFIQEE